MAKVTLPVSGAWVELRETLLVADRDAARGSFSITLGADGTQTLPGNLVGLQTEALLAELITGWGGPGLDNVPVPSLNPEGAAVIKRLITELDDYDALADEVQPMLERVNRLPNRKASTVS